MNLDQKLISACINGESKAQKQMFDILAPKMYALCIRYMSNREVAQDVLQDGFVTLFTKIGTYNGNGSFEGWARKIFVNTALMALRRNDPLLGSEELDSVAAIKTTQTTQLEAIEYKDLMKMIAELPPGYRLVFNMFAIEGYTHREISETLGISEGTSRSQLGRARAMLQEKIRKNK